MSGIRVKTDDKDKDKNEKLTKQDIKNVNNVNKIIFKNNNKIISEIEIPSFSQDETKYIYNVCYTIIDLSPNIYIKIQKSSNKNEIILNYDNSQNLNEDYKIIKEGLETYFKSIIIFDNENINKINSLYSFRTCDNKLFDKEYNKLIEKGYNINDLLTQKYNTMYYGEYYVFVIPNFKEDGEDIENKDDIESEEIEDEEDIEDKQDKHDEEDIEDKQDKQDKDTKDDENEEISERDINKILTTINNNINDFKLDFNNQTDEINETKINNYIKSNFDIMRTVNKVNLKFINDNSKYEIINYAFSLEAIKYILCMYNSIIKVYDEKLHYSMKYHDLTYYNSKDKLYEIELTYDDIYIKRDYKLIKQTINNIFGTILILTDNKLNSDTIIYSLQTCDTNLLDMEWDNLINNYEYDKTLTNEITTELSISNKIRVFVIPENKIEKIITDKQLINIHNLNKELNDSNEQLIDKTNEKMSKFNDLHPDFEYYNTDEIRINNYIKSKPITSNTIQGVGIVFVIGTQSQSLQYIACSTYAAKYIFCLIDSILELKLNDKYYFTNKNIKQFKSNSDNNIYGFELQYNNEDNKKHDYNLIKYIMSNKLHTLLILDNEDYEDANNIYSIQTCDDNIIDKEFKRINKISNKIKYNNEFSKEFENMSDNKLTYTIIFNKNEIDELIN